MKCKVWQLMLGVVMALGIAGGTVAAFATEGGGEDDEYPCHEARP